jgi:hypothetical protein
LTTAAFNTPGLKKVMYCSKHKKPGMINIKGRTCSHDECLTVPVFNLPGSKKGAFCRAHKTDDMIDVENPRCKTPMCGLHTPKEYCSRCTAHLFPDRPSNFKTRENAVGSFLRETYPDMDIVQDRRVECHLYRPDFVFDLGSHTVVVEIDENQHRSYDTSCDNKRLMSIFEGLGSRPMVMIRFNPDAYTGTRGCWTKDCTLVDGGRPWKRRLEVLRGRIDDWLGKEPGREMTIEHLFFDGY